MQKVHVVLRGGFIKCTCLSTRGRGGAQQDHYSVNTLGNYSGSFYPNKLCSMGFVYVKSLTIGCGKLWNDLHISNFQITVIFGQFSCNVGMEKSSFLQCYIIPLAKFN